jgi:broad specificity phosphatase PhoE
VYLWITMGTLYLVRHSQASFGSTEYDRLSPLGIRQAHILGDYFAHRGLEFQRFYSGEMQRQIATAHAVMSRLPGAPAESDLHVLPEFNEYKAHTILGHLVPGLIEEDPAIAEAVANLFSHSRALEVVFERAMTRWASGEYDVPGVESWVEFKRRVSKGVTRVMEEMGRKGKSVVFTSGGAICRTVGIALGISDEVALRLALQTLNTGVSTFKYRGADPILMSFNSVAHLELCNDPGLITYR